MLWQGMTTFAFGLASQAQAKKHSQRSGYSGLGGAWGPGGGQLGGNFGTGVRASISKPTLFIYLAFEKRTQYTRSSEIMTHSYTTR